MKWTITLDEENRFAEIATRGVADGPGSMKMVKAISIAMAQSKMTRLLIDHRNIRAVDGSSTEVYRRAENFQKIGVTLNIKVAEVVKPEHRAFFDFLETVCVNRGYQFAIFEDRPSALVWLLKP